MSRILHALLIHHLVSESRARGISKETSLQILSFLGDSIEGESFYNFESLQEVQDKVWSNWLPESKRLMTNKFLPLLSYFSENLDNFLDIRNVLLLIFKEEDDISYNELVGPSRITNDSLLGLFVRRLVIDLERFSFESNCLLFEEFRLYISKQSCILEYEREDGYGVVDADCQRRYILNKRTTRMKSIGYDYLIHTSGTCDDTSQFNVSIEDGSSLIMFALQKAIALEDVLTAEALIHLLFDHNGNSTFASLPQPPSQFTSSTIDVDSKILQLSNSLRESESHVDFSNRHQHSLLSLGILWLKNNCFDYAINSLEEGLKIAHQREDHNTVARALLLFYEIYKSEDLLMRSLDRCVSLNQRLLAAQSTILLALHRSHRKTVDRKLDYAKVTDHSGPIGSTLLRIFVNSLSASTLKGERVISGGKDCCQPVVWILLLSALYGDMSMSMIVSKHYETNALFNALQYYSAASSPSMAGPFNQPRKEQAQSESCLTILEYLLVCFPSKQVACVVWLRYGLFQLALRNWQSALNTVVTKYFTNEDLLSISCDLIRTHMDYIDYQFIMMENYEFVRLSNVQTALRSTYDVCVRMLCILKSTFHSSVPSSFDRKMRMTRHYIDAFYYYHIEPSAFQTNQVTTSLGSCLSLCESECRRDVENGIIWNEAYAKLMLLKCRLAQRVDTDEAIVMYKSVETECSRSDETTAIKYVASIIRLNHMVRSDLPIGNDIILKLRDLLQLAASEGYSSFEGYVARNTLHITLETG